MELPHFFDQGELLVSHCGEKPWRVRHEFNPPSSADAIATAQEEIGIEIPEPIISFWKKSDGAVLYKNVDGDRWGWKIISTKRYLESQHKWRRHFFDHWDIRYLLIAEVIVPHQAVVVCEQEVLILDESIDCMRPIVIAQNTESFFKKLYQTQGGLWWQW